MKKIFPGFEAANHRFLFRENDRETHEQTLPEFVDMPLAPEVKAAVDNTQGGVLEMLGEKTQADSDKQYYLSHQKINQTAHMARDLLQDIFDLELSNIEFSVLRRIVREVTEAGVRDMEAGVSSPFSSLESEAITIFMNDYYGISVSELEKVLETGEVPEEMKEFLRQQQAFEHKL